MNDPNWKKVEKVVARLEKSISPNARIEHNQYLPDLTSEGTTRQCDVVIYTGNSPRETLHIVEVQDRESPMKINEFDGFVTKMKTVGAQHLICVTKQNYSTTIINRAKSLGPTVRLLTLKQIEPQNLPLNFGNSLVISQCIQRSYSNFDQSFPPNSDPTIPKDGTFHNKDDKFIVYRQIKFSLADYTTMYIKEKEINLIKGDNLIHVDSRKLSYPSFYLHNKKRNLFRFNYDVNVELVEKEIPISCSEYKQVNEDGADGWVVTVDGEYNGERFMFDITLIYDMKTGLIKGEYPKLTSALRGAKIVTN